MEASISFMAPYLGLQQPPAGFFCSSHPDEAVSYYCFSCHSECVCPECIIHGTHKDHEVQKIKKAFSILKKTLTESLAEIEGHLGQSDEVKGLSRHKDSLGSQFISSLNALKNKFAVNLHSFGLRIGSRKCGLLCARSKRRRSRK